MPDLRLQGYQRGAKSATRAKGGPKHHAQDYAGGGHTHPPARNGTSTKVHKTVRCIDKCRYTAARGFLDTWNVLRDYL